MSMLIVFLLTIFPPVALMWCRSANHCLSFASAAYWTHAHGSVLKCSTTQPSTWSVQHCLIRVCVRVHVVFLSVLLPWTSRRVWCRFGLWSHPSPTPCTVTSSQQQVYSQPSSLVHIHGHHPVNVNNWSFMCVFVLLLVCSWAEHKCAAFIQSGRIPLKDIEEQVSTLAVAHCGSFDSTHLRPLTFGPSLLMGSDFGFTLRINGGSVSQMRHSTWILMMSSVKYSLRSVACRSIGDECSAGTSFSLKAQIKKHR